ncbi:hypothetical protein EVAR_14890_1 [Eumeta japonica]|uniref:Uncharacterized protein n=1 Tax=Eumeta variegata TaxID=151549 RepID=A0A4C1V3R9_EUMVA|nr:hypothetical protein EVAR_14890_1 [Eumeta japonica]
MRNNIGVHETEKKATQQRDIETYTLGACSKSANYFELFTRVMPAGLCLLKRLVEWNDTVKLLEALQRRRRQLGEYKRIKKLILYLHGPMLSGRSLLNEVIVQKKWRIQSKGDLIKNKSNTRVRLSFKIKWETRYRIFSSIIVGSIAFILPAILDSDRPQVCRAGLGSPLLNLHSRPEILRVDSCRSRRRSGRRVFQFMSLRSQSRKSIGSDKQRRSRVAAAARRAGAAARLVSVVLGRSERRLSSRFEEERSN